MRSKVRLGLWLRWRLRARRRQGMTDRDGQSEWDTTVDACPALALSQSSLVGWIQFLRRGWFWENVPSSRQSRHRSRRSLSRGRRGRGQGRVRRRKDREDPRLASRIQSPVTSQYQGARRSDGRGRHGARGTQGTRHRAEGTGQRTQDTGHRTPAEWALDTGHTGRGRKRERKQREDDDVGVQSLTIDGPTGQTWQSRVGRQRARQGW